MEGGGGDRENGQGQERGDRGGSGAGNLGQGGQGSGAPLGSSSQAHTGQNDQASVVNILSQIRAGRSGRVYASQIQRQPNALTRAQSLGTSTTTDAQGRFQIHSYNSSPGGGPQMDICAPLPGVPGGLDILTQDPEAIVSVVRATLQQPGVSSVEVVIFPNHSAEQLDEMARTTGSPIQPAELSGVNFRTVRRAARRRARAARRQAREAAAQPAPSNETNIEPPDDFDGANTASRREGMAAYFRHHGVDQGVSRWRRDMEQPVCRLIRREGTTQLSVAALEFRVDMATWGAICESSPLSQPSMS